VPLPRRINSDGEHNALVQELAEIEVHTGVDSGYFRSIASNPVVRDEGVGDPGPAHGIRQDTGGENATGESKDQGATPGFGAGDRRSL